MGVCLMRLGRLDEAEAAFFRVLQIVPGYKTVQVRPFPCFCFLCLSMGIFSHHYVQDNLADLQRIKRLMVERGLVKTS